MRLSGKSSCELPEDVQTALLQARDSEQKQSIAYHILDLILENIKAAKERQYPICQDTGLPVFYINYPSGISTSGITECIRKSGGDRNRTGISCAQCSGCPDRCQQREQSGKKIPYLSFTEWERPEIEVTCLLKGGGSENVSIQYSLPDTKLFAGRDFAGAAACIVDAVIRAQGKGCAPGIIGVGIGGDRISGMQTAKEQLLRRLDDKNANAELNKMEKNLYSMLNKLGIGPMGLGGKSTVLGVKIGTARQDPGFLFCFRFLYVLGLPESGPALPALKYTGEESSERREYEKKTHRFAPQQFGDTRNAYRRGTAAFGKDHHGEGPCTPLDA
ncbi:MAG: fumarate hydratase [Candidatus Marinimicrobia bacterium]|nr:fumarate hydratase [Candidatus Neomarinimicrobiota bacterium]